MNARTSGTWLLLLAGLFVVRVLAQPAALILDGSLLPPFDAWHGGVLPYPLLAATQIAIVIWLAWTARRVSAGAVIPHPRLGRWVFAVGVVYFDVMFTRFVLGLTLLRGYRWFASPLPALLSSSIGFISDALRPFSPAADLKVRPTIGMSRRALRAALESRPDLQVRR